MRNDKGQNYIFTAFLTVAMVIAALLLLFFVPSFEIFGLSVKRTNILSDIIEIEDESVDSQQDEQLELLDQADSILLSLEPKVLEAVQDSSSKEKQAEKDPSPKSDPSELSNSEPWEIAQSVGTAANSITDLDRPLIDSKVPTSTTAAIDAEREITKIEDFGVEESALEDFRKALTRKGAKRPLRIAVLGDSFIENDIITADLRENFQGGLGGNGVGFVAFATPIAKYRQTVEHTFSDWEVYSIMSPKKTPEKYLDKFYISGLLCVPSEGAKVTMSSTTFRKYTKQSTVARLLFINEKNTELRVTINDTLERVFRPAPSQKVQEIVISGNIEKFDMSVHKVDGFVGYGVVFEDRSGVCIDNYSVRGTSGLPLFKTNAQINKDVDKMLSYDLVILEFGLNIMQAEVLKYESFSNSLSRIIKYVRGCFPNASVMVMGVGDRCHEVNGKVETMQAVYGVLEAQRNAAKTEGAAFWNTFEAMGGKNSMIGFTERKWAAKDYLHIGYGGGKYIAEQMYKSLMDFELESKEELEPEVLDSLAIDSLAIDTLNRDTLLLDHRIDSLASDSLWLDLIEGDSIVLDSVLMDSLLGRTGLNPIPEQVVVDTLILE